jgi:hypothetical protein
MSGKIRAPRRVSIVVCADGYACVKPGYVHSRWEHSGRNPYPHRIEALRVAHELDSFATRAGRAWPPAACGPHRVVSYVPESFLARAKSRGLLRQASRRRARQ